MKRRTAVPHGGGVPEKNQDLVRPSRDGDQFHYHWAARQCLQLLPSSTDLEVVTIEGSSEAKTMGGEDLIDVGLYFGGEDVARAATVRYVQLKHSTRDARKPWTASGLKRTVAGFANRYTELCARFSSADVAARIRFEFTTNRPIAQKVREALEDLRMGLPGPRHPDVQDALVGYSNLPWSAVADFFGVFHVDGDEDDLWAQRNLLSRDTCAYLVESDSDAPVQLKELVTRKATTEFESNHRILRHDVLRALKASEEQLLPAPRGAPTAQSLPREQEAELLNALLTTTSPIILHADGGVGKSVIASRLATSMPPGSEAILYDCFGDGLYRNALNFRHRHKDALVQIANELAAKGLCDPLIPTSRADAKDYMRAFVARLAQAAGLLRARNADARLCVIIDAADNAEIAAREQLEPGSFVRDLIHCGPLSGVGFMFTCRTHRRDSLHAPVGAQELELRSFSEPESAAHLRAQYAMASDSEVGEFAFLSSANPRVQALLMSRALPLPEMLAQLGPSPTTVDGAIGDLLDRVVAKLRDQSEGEAPQINRICQGLAILRPLIPVAVLAALAGVSEAAVRSFVFDFGHSILLKGNSVHFLDEPTETWFRERFDPAPSELAEFLGRLRPITSSSSYAAAVLPMLLLRGDRLDELVQLALSGSHLPSNPIEKRDVELQRLKFALKACLGSGRHEDAAKLALKAGGECAGEERQFGVIQDHTDLVASVVGADGIEQLISRRLFKTTWMGSHHVYEAALLAGTGRHAEAASRFRMANDWLRAWGRLPEQQRSRAPVTREDIVEFCLVGLHLKGAQAAAEWLKKTTRRTSFEVSRRLSKRLVDLGHFRQLDDWVSAGNTCILLGAASALNAVGRTMRAAPLARLLRVLQRVRLVESSDHDDEWAVLDSVRSAVEMALRTLAPNHAAWAVLLRRYLPEQPDALGRRFGKRARLLRAYALEVALRGAQLTVDEVTPSGVRELVRRRTPTYETDIFEFEVRGLLPWFVLVAEIACRRPISLSDRISAANRETESAISRNYRPEAQHIRRKVATSWGESRRTSNPDLPELEAFASWVNEHGETLGSDTLTALCRLAARTAGWEQFAMDLATAAYGALEASRDQADSRVDSYVTLARAVFAVSVDESRAYFERAVELADSVGSENLERWRALLNLAGTAGSGMRARTAHRLSRVAELTYEHVVRDKHFDWVKTVEALADLSPPSSLAILSRWRDRRFGNSKRLLPIVIERLVRNGHLPQVAPVVLAGIDGHWDRLDDLKTALSSEKDAARRLLITQVAYRYMRVESADGALDWSKVSEFVATQGLDLPDLPRLAEADRARKVKAEQQEREREGSLSRGHTPSERQPTDWNAVFEGVDLLNSDALRSIYVSFSSYNIVETFFREALERVGVGQRAEFVKTVTTLPDFGVITLQHLVRSLSPVPNHLALRKAIHDAALSACRRQPELVVRSGWAAELAPFESLMAQGIVQDEEVAKATAEGWTSRAEELNAARLFQVVDPLAAVLTPDEADRVLNYGLDLLEDVLKPDEGDGPWRVELEPPDSVVDALAGYIWAGLASPVAAERWEQAHVVRSAIELGWRELVDALLARAASGGGGVFVDQRFEFYAWHARQWLLIGLVRGGKENPAALQPAAPLLNAWAHEDHVVIRQLASQCLQLLGADGLEGVNQPKLSERVYSGFPAPVDDESSVNDDDDREHYFFPDIGPYWLEPLGRLFGLSQRAAERRTRRILNEHMRCPESDGEDARRRLKIFADRETWHSHGTLPSTDDSRAYNAYHAMMMVAATLLKERPPQRHEEETEAPFHAWLSQYVLMPESGWLADKRDPRLPPEPSWPRGYRDELWCSTVPYAYFDELLMTDDGMRVLWGRWSGRDFDHSERVSIRSALVSSCEAEALVAALQTAPDRFALPRAGEDADLHLGTLRMLAWVGDGENDSRPDSADPWATGIGHPGPSPADPIKLGLTLSNDGRVWTDGIGASLRREHWAVVDGNGDDRDTLSGERLSGTRAFVQHLLRAHPGMTLIVGVHVRRDVRSSGEYRPPNARYFLIGDDGVAHSLSSRT